MKAIIIAAGYSSRLGNYIKETPKALLNINGKTILERQTGLLKANLVKDIIIITGPNKSKFDHSEFTFVNDVLYKEHEQLGSLMTAKDYFNDELLILFSDVLFDNEIIKTIIESKYEYGIGIDLDWEKGYEGRTEHPKSEADLALIQQNSIVGIKKNISKKHENEKIGEFLGIMKMSISGSTKFKEKFEELERTHEGTFHDAPSLKKAYLTDMIQELIHNNERVYPIIIKGKWCEIDTSQDLERVQKIFK